MVRIDKERLKLIAAVIFLIVMVIHTIYLPWDFTTPPREGFRPRMLSPGTVKVLMYAFLLMLAIIGAYALFRHLMYRRKGRRMAMISDEGLYIMDDCIPWDQIKNVCLNKGNKIIFVTTRRAFEKKAIEQARWPKRLLWKINRSLIGTPFEITRTCYEGTPEAFYEECCKRLPPKPVRKRRKRKAKTEETENEPGKREDNVKETNSQ